MLHPGACMQHVLCFYDRLHHSTCFHDYKQVYNYKIQCTKILLLFPFGFQVFFFRFSPIACYADLYCSNQFSDCSPRLAESSIEFRCNRCHSDAHIHMRFSAMALGVSLTRLRVFIVNIFYIFENCYEFKIIVLKSQYLFEIFIFKHIMRIFTNKCQYTDMRQY